MSWKNIADGSFDDTNLRPAKAYYFDKVIGNVDDDYRWMIDIHKTKLLE